MRLSFDDKDMRQLTETEESGNHIDAQPKPQQYRQTKRNGSIFPIICGILMTLVCFSLFKDSFSTLFIPRITGDNSQMSVRERKIDEQTRNFIDQKHPDLHRKGLIGAGFFFLLSGFGLLFFGLGTGFVIYKEWIRPTRVQLR